MRLWFCANFTHKALKIHAFAFLCKILCKILRKNPKWHKFIVSKKLNIAILVIFFYQNIVIAVYLSTINRVFFLYALDKFHIILYDFAVVLFYLFL